jgi:hypothetical protein
VDSPRDWRVAGMRSDGLGVGLDRFSGLGIVFVQVEGRVELGLAGE